MAYAIRRRSGRKGRRGNRTLSTRRIFNNKSARSQAKQISALNRRISRVYRATRPEVKVVEQAAYNAIQFLPGNRTTWEMAHIVPNLGTADDQRVGSAIKMIAPTLFFSAKYYDVTHTTNGVPVYNMINGNRGAALRVIAIQSKVARDNVPGLGAILHNNISNSFTDIDTIPNLRIPFEVGITTQYNVVYDKVFYFNQNRPMISKRITFKPPRKALNWNPANGTDQTYVYPAGQIFVYFIQGGLQSTGLDLTTNDHSEIALTYTQKLAYTDS